MAKTRDANRIIDNVTGDDEELQQMIAEETVNAEVARLIYEARKMAGLTQTELAELIGSKQPVIARLEDADYESAPGRTRTCDQRSRVGSKRVDLMPFWLGYISSIVVKPKRV